MNVTAPTSADDDAFLYFDISRKSFTSVRFSESGTKTVVNTNIETIYGFASENGDVPSLDGTPDIHFSRTIVEEIVYRPELPEANEVATERRETLSVSPRNVPAPSIISEPPQELLSLKSLHAAEEVSETIEADHVLSVVEVITPTTKSPMSDAETEEDPEESEARRGLEELSITKTRIVVEKFA